MTPSFPTCRTMENSVQKSGYYSDKKFIPEAKECAKDSRERGATLMIQSEADCMKQLKLWML